MQVPNWRCPLLSKEQEQLVMDEIRRHYSEHSQPYYLAGLGQFFQSKSITVPTGKQFKDFLSETFPGRLVVVQDPTVPAKIAIALLEQQEQVQQQLAGRILPTPGHPPIEVNRLPFSLIAAFCQKPGSDDRVYYRTVRPCRYVIGSGAPDHSYVEIDEQFRRSIPEGTSVHGLSSEVKQEIYRRISEWAATKSVDLETIYVVERGRLPSPGTSRGIPISNALQRLIEAQEPDLRKRIQVPGDIALALMRLE